jgi:hypothetical protein
MKLNAKLTMIIGIIISLLGGAVFYLGYQQHKFANKVIELPNGEKGLLLE